MKNQSRKILIRLMLLAVILLINIFGWSQIQVTGTVTGENETLVGATVVVKGTSDGVITDLNGEYSIEVPDESSVLIFSYVGFIKQEIKVGNQQ
ncbi:MAG TPA: carboxypeptidase-like regulatory domain-containing protein, partial [Prolixibacteraceae bacterium]|nr:carboxypeptidase-like regulatory domain-containing protein [Prolixibacteraceae bacterium]